MRLSVLALFIALPAAAYAAVPQQRSTDSEDPTSHRRCRKDSDCPAGFFCESVEVAGVCLIAHLL